MNKTMRRSAVLLGVASLLFLSACTDDDPDDVVTQTVTATATVTATPSPSPTATGLAAATQKVHLVCPEPFGEVDALTDPNDQWGPAYFDGSNALVPVAFGEIVGTGSDGSKFSDPAQTKPGATKEGSMKCAFTSTFTDTDSGEDVTVKLVGTVWAYPDTIR